MLKRVKFDDSGRIYFNFEDTTIEELDNSGLSYFDVYNMPFDGYGLTNYYLSFFECKKSKTGYVGMFVHKDWETFNKKIGYTEDTKLEISYTYGV
jgi:hypothetical protein